MEYNATMGITAENLALNNNKLSQFACTMYKKIVKVIYQREFR